MLRLEVIILIYIRDLLTISLIERVMAHHKKFHTEQAVVMILLPMMVMVLFRVY